MRDTAAMHEHSPATPQRTARRGAIGIALFWVLLAGALFAVFKWVEEQERQSLVPYTTGDGHFYVNGEVNRVPVRFLVDTGASAVSVSDAQAQQAQLPEGRPITLQTANGERPGRLVHGVPVKVGHLALNNVTVVSGLTGLPRAAGHEPLRTALHQSAGRHQADACVGTGDKDDATRQ